jgi:hypothetical protein
MEGILPKRNGGPNLEKAQRVDADPGSWDPCASAYASGRGLLYVDGMPDIQEIVAPSLGQGSKTPYQARTVSRRRRIEVPNDLWRSEPEPKTVGIEVKKEQAKCWPIC